MAERRKRSTPKRKLNRRRRSPGLVTYTFQKGSRPCECERCRCGVAPGPNDLHIRISFPKPALDAEGLEECQRAEAKAAAEVKRARVRAEARKDAHAELRKDGVQWIS
jgi:hypothetical protein